VLEQEHPSPLKCNAVISVKHLNLQIVAESSAGPIRIVATTSQERACSCPGPRRAGSPADWKSRACWQPGLGRLWHLTMSMGLDKTRHCGALLGPATCRRSYAGFTHNALRWADIRLCIVRFRHGQSLTVSGIPGDPALTCIVGAQQLIGERLDRPEQSPDGETIALLSSVGLLHLIR
jgi:hypothetical protein